MEGLARDVAMAASIVQLAAAGDAVAFARIVAAYHADMVRVAYVVSGGDQDVADDAVQAAWSIAWRKLDSLRDPDRLKPWLVAVAANEARQLCRRQRSRWVVHLDVGLTELGIIDPAEPDPAGRADALDLEAALQRRAVIEATGTTDDPRVAGTTRFTTNGPVCGVVGFQWGTMSTTNADGAWEGTCTGGMWGNGDVNDISCWLVGSGAYKGLTYYKHTRTAGLSFADDGVILPAPPPATP